MAKNTDLTTQSVIPSLTLKDAAKAIELYKKAFGAQEEGRMNGPDGKIVHAILRIGSSKIFLADTDPKMNATPSVSGFYVYFPDVDAIFKQAKQAGLSEKFPVTDMFWGDRMGALTDPFGIKWTLATKVREVSPAELEEGAKKMFASSKAA
jgi:PhnB protein